MHARKGGGFADDFDGRRQAWQFMDARSIRAKKREKAGPTRADFPVAEAGENYMTR